MLWGAGIVSREPHRPSGCYAVPPRSDQRVLRSYLRYCPLGPRWLMDPSFVAVTVISGAGEGKRVLWFVGEREGSQAVCPLAICVHPQQVSQGFSLDKLRVKEIQKNTTWAAPLGQPFVKPNFPSNTFPNGCPQPGNRPTPLQPPHVFVKHGKRLQRFGANT